MNNLVVTSPRLPIRTRSNKIAIVLVSASLLVILSHDSTYTVGQNMKFGVLDSTCAEDRVGPLSRAGVELAHIDVLWDRLEPVAGQLDSAYADQLATTIDACQAAGIEVILGLGMQYAPGWVKGLPNGTYRDQAGNPYPGQVPNVVFSIHVREAFENHAANVLRIARRGSVHAIRLGTSEAGELGYPLTARGEGRERSATRFWAFTNAEKVAIDSVPPDVGHAPLPGWKPGDGTWHGEEVTSDQVASWFAWYSEAPVVAVLWQAHMLRGLGFSGKFHLPLAGWGTSPSRLNTAINSKLIDVEDPDGSLERGLYYPEQLKFLTEEAERDAFIADVTGLDDVTAVQARSNEPKTDSCSPVDHLVDLTSDPDVEDWSSSRWTIANARKVGLQVIGENPGSPYASNTGGHPESDDLQSQMEFAPQYASECGLSAFLWAFEDNLFSDPQNLRLNEYSRIISAYQ